MTVNDILNNIDIQNEYVIVYYDSEKEQRVKLEECTFSRTIEIRYMYVEKDILFFELDEDHLFSGVDRITANRDIVFLNPTKI